MFLTALNAVGCQLSHAHLPGNALLAVPDSFTSASEYRTAVTDDPLQGQQGSATICTDIIQ